MSPDDSKKLLIAKVKSMLLELEERTGSNPYSDFNLELYSIDELEKIRKDVHEVIYAPPSRQR